MIVNRKKKRWFAIAGIIAVILITGACADAGKKSKQPAYPEIAAADATIPEQTPASIPEPAFNDENATYENGDYFNGDFDDAEITVPLGPAEAGVGDTIEVEKGLFLTVNGIRADSGGFWAPNGIYLIIDCTYENKSKDEKHLSTLLNLTVKDADGYKYDPAILADTKGSLDGALAAGDKVRGEVAFDVPDDTTVEYFCFDPFLVFSQSQSRWRIAVNVRAV